MIKYWYDSHFLRDGVLGDKLLVETDSLVLPFISLVDTIR